MKSTKSGRLLTFLVVFCITVRFLTTQEIINNTTPAQENTTTTFTGIYHKHLIQARYCDNQVLQEDQRYRTVWVRSKIECVAVCRLDEDCVSIVYDKGQAQCHLADSRAFANCTNMEPAEHAASFYQQPPPCGYGETLGPLGLCICARGFNGTPCVRYFHDCADHYYHGNWMGDDEYTIQPLDSPEPFRVFCRFIANVRLHVMVRKKNKKQEDFNRPWNDYRDGFGSYDRDFWIGLEKLHLVTSADRSYKLRVTIRLINDTSIVHEYNDFKVSDEASGYRLFFNTSVLNGPDDCLLPLLDAKFSTYDHDNDEAANLNCASVRKGGWWYRGSGCGSCSPHGIIYKRSDGKLQGEQDEVFWSFLGNAAPYKLNMYLVPGDAVEE